MYILLHETRSWVAQRLARPAYILGVWRGPGFKSYNSHYSRVNLSEVASAGFTREKIGHRTFFFSKWHRTRFIRHTVKRVDTNKFSAFYLKCEAPLFTL